MIRIELDPESARVCDRMVFRLPSGAVGSWRDVAPCELVEALLERADRYEAALVPDRGKITRLRLIACAIGDALDAIPARRPTPAERALAHAQLPVWLRDPGFVLT